MPEKLKSRKLWVTTVTVVLMFVNDLIGLDLDEQTINSIAVAVGAYVVGQSAVDFQQATERARKYEAWVAKAVPTYTPDEEA